MVLDSKGVSDIDFVSLVCLQVLNLANACKLGLVVMCLSLLKCQVLLLEFIGDPPELVKQRFDVQNLFLLYVCALKHLEGW